MTRPSVVQGEPPRWALELASRASRVLSCAPPEEISWRETRYTRSSGCYWKERKRIHVSAGTDRLDQRYVVLHEVAHHVLSQNGKDTGRSHGPDFWSACLILCRKFRVPAHHLRRRHRSRTLRRILA